MLLNSLKKMPVDIVYDELPSPLGKVMVLASNRGIYAIFFAHRTSKKTIAHFKKANKHRMIQAIKTQLQEYFQHKRKHFTVPVILLGTPFQVKAWRELKKIPYGKTISYEEQARRIGNRNKARAVGMANARNPIAIVIPCHRVIGKNGKLTGFAGGLNKKQYLLDLEAKT